MALSDLLNVESPSGAVYIRFTEDGYLLVSGDVAGAKAMRDVADPGNAEAIPVTVNAHIAMTTGASGETGTLGAPAFAGQRLTLVLDVDGGGDRVITATPAVNVAGNNTLTFNTAGQAIMLEGVQVGGSLVWRVVANDGVGLSTV